MRMYGHYTAHAIGQQTPLADHAAAQWLWDALRRAFPDAIAAALMPDHPHLIMPLGRQRRFAAILAAFTRTLGYGELWRDGDEPMPLTSIDKLQRGVRYTALNPCRPASLAGRRVVLVADPLMWLWSTHRDVVGAVADPWIDVDRLRCAVGWEESEFRERWHHYVSADPDVAVAGTPFPEATTCHHLRSIARAALAATRSEPEALRRSSDARTTFVGLAHRCGWRSVWRLSKWCDVHPNSISLIASRCPTAWVDAAALCLGDVRLRRSAEEVRFSNAEPVTKARSHEKEVECNDILRTT